MIKRTAAVTFAIAIALMIPTTSAAEAAPTTTYKVCSDSSTGNDVTYYDDLGKQETKEMPMRLEDGLYCAVYAFHPKEYQFEAVTISGNGSLGYASCSISHGTTVVASSRDYDEYGNAYASCTV